QRQTRKHKTARSFEQAADPSWLSDPAYQRSFNANWNCRASYAAVGCPARHTVPAAGSHNWLTAAIFVRFNMLNPSAIRSTLHRSPSGIVFDNRISIWKNPGPVKAFRPRLPAQPAGGVKNGTVKGVPALVRQTSATPNCVPEMNGEVVPLETTEGRAWEAPRSRRVSVPVMTLNGRPEDTS